jgi:hypothetical protein
MSEQMKKAIERIRVLRSLSQKTGIITKSEQIQVLLSLDNEEMMQVADLLFKNHMINVLGGAR